MPGSKDNATRKLSSAPLEKPEQGMAFLMLIETEYRFSTFDPMEDMGTSGPHSCLPYG
jgi:hypothetical protein